MTPEPTPVAGMSVTSFGLIPALDVIWTTAGLTLAAASTTADDSSNRAACCVLVDWPVAGVAVDRFRTPLAFRAR